MRKEIVGRLFLLWVLGFPPFVDACVQYRHKSEAEVASASPKQRVNQYAQYKHKSEAEIAAMTPAQRVDECANEQAFHKYDFLDQQYELIYKYILRDGFKALPRMSEIIGEYDPGTASGKADHKGERFDAMWMLLGALDNVIRLRASPEGRQAMDALARAIDRMRAVGYGKAGQHEWAEHGRFDLAVAALEDAKGANATDEVIRDTLWVRYKLKISDRELLAFSNFLVARDPSYPSWSGSYDIKDYSRVNSAGNAAQVNIMKNPERFYEAYLEFKRSKR